MVAFPDNAEERFESLYRANNINYIGWRDDGTGLRDRLKICWAELPLRVRVPLALQNYKYLICLNVNAEENFKHKVR